MKLKPQILIGADPELFCKNELGEFVSGHDMCPGTKSEPHKVDFGAVQADGTAFEFNIDPASTVDEFAHHIRVVREKLATFAPGHNLVPEPVAHYNKAYFNALPASAKTLGCDPDYNAWTLKQNDPPNSGKVPFRTGAGHIHIGWTQDEDIWETNHFYKAAAIARQLDYYLGIWSLGWDPNKVRRTLYGKAGAFRPKPYGMEYRVLSNAWLSSPILTRWVYMSAYRGVENFFNEERAEYFFQDSARHIIDDNETDWLTKYDFDLDVPPLPKEYLKVA